MARKQGTFTSRTKARKRAADVIFEAEQRGATKSRNGLSDLLEQRKQITAAQTPLPPYAITIVSGVANLLPTIDKLIMKRAKVEGLDRLPGVDLAVLRVAVWEMLANSGDVDPVIAIDEAVAIVKSISTDKSPSFVNAVLDAVRRDIAKENSSPKKLNGLPEEKSENYSKDPEVDSIFSENESEVWDELLDEY